jgi:site-specific recombinase XerD
MTEYLFSESVLKRLYVGPLKPSLHSFEALLSDRGYTRYSIKDKIRLIARFSEWIHQQHLEVNELNGQVINKFIRCKGRKGSVRRGDFATLRLLLQHLGNTEVTPNLENEDCIVHHIEKGFAQYLSQERGLSPATLVSYIPMVRHFLTDRFNAGPIQIVKLSPSDVSTFILRYARTVKRKTAKLMVSSLRAFFRYLHLRGEIAVDLVEFIPTIADWRLSDIPKSLEAQQVERLLSSCDRSNKNGQRDYVILLLLARLGLRAGEIVKMTLDDIDWIAGELIIEGKGPRKDRLPLPWDVGKALVTYLQHGRPSCSTRRVFIRTRAPHNGFSSSVAVCNIVRRALLRAKLQPPCKGAHLLRHSLATHMLSKGASLTEISEILRHASIDTTEIYTKVDIAALRSLAQSWPGGVE